MKGKPPFILYNNINKPQTSQFTKKPKNPLRLIYSRIPYAVLKETPVIEKLIHPESKIHYSEISKYHKPKMIKIDNNMSDSQQKKISNLNEFKEMFYNYNQEEREQLSNFVEVQEENDKFSHNYKKVQKDKNKFSTGTYLDHQYLVGLASRYAMRGIKVPKISSDKNVFSANPLILGGSDLEHYFLYNLGDRKKSSIFLNKVENLITKKLTGNYVFTDKEMKKFEALQKNEIPKGYISPNILIPKLKNDIKQIQDTYDNLDDFDKFFENKDKESNTQIKKRIIPKLGSTRSYNNILSDIYQRNINTTKNNKIIIKKNLSFINNININNNNKYTSISTRAYGASKRFSSSNSRNIISYKDISKSNISSAVSREKSKNIKYSPILSPFSHRNNTNTYNNLFNEITKNNNSNDFFILSKPFEYPEKNTFNFLYDNIGKNNNKSTGNILNLKNNKKIIKKNLILLRKNSSFSKTSKETKLKSENNISKEDKEQESEYDDIKLLNKELENNDDTKNDNKEIEKSKENSKRNIDDNITNKNIDNQKNEEIKYNNEISENRENKTIKVNENVEKIFDSVIANGYKFRRNKNVIKDFLKSKGYNTEKKFASKDAYININRMKTKAIERNFLLEEFRIRNGEYTKTPLSHKQQAIIEKNEIYEKEIEKNEYTLKKLLCEKNIDKDNIDF